MNQMARETARRQRQAAQAEQARIRANDLAIKQELKRRALADKEAKQQYIESRIQETEEANYELLCKLKEISSILEKTLNIDDKIQFDKLRIADEYHKFELPTNLQEEVAFTRRDEYFSKLPKPSGIEKLVPGWEKRYQKRVEEAERLYKDYLEKYEKFVSERKAKIASLQQEYDVEKQAFELKKKQQNQDVDELETAYKNGDPAAVTAYCSMVLEHSSYTENFPKEFRIAYIPEPKELVVEYQLPDKSIVPAVTEYKYAKTKDVIEEKPRKTSEIKEIYQDVISAICLRTIHELFEADQCGHLEVIVFNGFVEVVDPATGKDIRPHLITIRTTVDKFKEVNLAKIDKKACLRNLGAQVSTRPDELVAVKPVIEFDMVDKRFVEESDIISNLENRPNLMDLSPFEFENLINNLFDRIGFNSKTTQSSRDGGVDVVAFDPRPILGGKVVIQAKRYKNVVGVSAVRDLYGTMINEGANKGILVATSHYGKDAYEFAKDKPIELIDGGGLLYLLEQNGVQARIIFPDE
jgi:restriction system protein